MKRKASFIILVLGLLFVLAFVDLNLQPLKFLSGIGNLFAFTKIALPPDMRVLPLAFTALLETLEIAFLGTGIGAAIALPLGIIASRNLFSSCVTIPTRLCLAIIRTIPSLIWALVFVVMVGLGPFAGVLATALYTVGYLGKLHYEAIEGINPAPLEALYGTGVRKLQIIRFVVWGEAAHSLLGQILFMFEYNIRASSILGFVGAGGIGFYILGYMRLLQYDKVVVLLLLMLITTLGIEYVSLKVRERHLRW